MRKEFLYSALTGLAVAGLIGLTSFAANSNPAIPHIIPSPQAAPQVKVVNTERSTPDTEVADIPDTGVSDEGKTETQDDVIALPAGSISEVAASKIATDAHAGTTVIGFETEDEDGVVIYSVSLSNGTDVEIDPVKGTILSTEKEGNDANEAKDSENDLGDRDQDRK